MLWQIAQGALLAAAEGEEPEGIDLIIPETNELIAGIIAFAIVFFFIWKWAVPAINRALEARRQAVAGQLEEAEKAKLEAQSLLDDYRQQLAGTRQEAGRIIDEARQTADQVKADIVAKAEAEADEIRRKARQDAEAERARLRTEMRDEMASLSLDVAERVIGSELDADAQRRLVDRYLAELESMPAGGNGGS